MENYRFIELSMRRLEITITKPVFDAWHQAYKTVEMGQNGLLAL
jgi:hypothetical protein